MFAEATDISLHKHVAEVDSQSQHSWVRFSEVGRVVTMTLLRTLPSLSPRDSADF